MITTKCVAISIYSLELDFANYIDVSECVWGLCNCFCPLGLNLYRPVVRWYRLSAFGWYFAIRKS